jgi:hypothetical protein
MHDIARRELIDPALDKLEREIAKLNRTSGGFLGIEARLERDRRPTRFAGTHTRPGGESSSAGCTERAALLASGSVVART